MKTKLRWLVRAGLSVLILLAVVKAGAEWWPPPDPPNPDGDGDGLLDAWEIQYFGNLYQNGSGDPDGDGLTNLQEQQGGTNPTVYNSSFGLSGSSALLVFTPLKP